MKNIRYFKRRYILLISLIIFIIGIVLIFFVSSILLIKTNIDLKIKVPPLSAF